MFTQTHPILQAQAQSFLQGMAYAELPDNEFTSYELRTNFAE